MPDLLTSLQKHDLGHIRIVAELWGLQLDSNETEAAAKELSASLLNPDLLAEILETLNPEAQAALEALTAGSGRIPWAEFIRQYGDIREIGPGKRDREKPHRQPSFHSGNSFLPRTPGTRLFRYIQRPAGIYLYPR